MKFKNEKGITGVDIAIAMVILIIFSGLIISFYMNIYKVIAETKIHQTIITYMVQICEKIDAEDYEEVDTVEEVNTIISGMNILEGYTITPSVEKYSGDDPNKKDIVEKISFNISYQFDGETKNFNIKKIKVKEND